MPTDGSRLADRVIGHIERLVQPGVSTVELVTVVSDAVARGAAKGDEGFDRAKAHLAELETRVAKHGVRVKTAVLIGDPADEILKFAARIEPTLIALSTHGRSGVERWIRGSTAERILRESTYPLLLTNPFASPLGHVAEWTRILVPVDGSPESASVLPVAAELARAGDAELVLFHAIEQGPSGADAGRRRLAAREQLKTMAGELDGVRTRIVVATNKTTPAEAILRAVTAERADLVVLASHGRTGVSRWIMGSVAEGVLRECRQPVLINRVARRPLEQRTTTRR